MSRGSIRTFLVSAKRHLHQALKNGSHASLVIGNESADLDSIACALLYSYLQSNRAQSGPSSPFSSSTKDLLIPITNIPAADLPLRPELTALLRHADLQPSDLITLDDLSALSHHPPEKTAWTLVDHNVFLGPLGQRFQSRVIAVLDHHDDESRVPPTAEPRIIEKAGSCSSLITNFCQETWNPNDDNSDDAAETQRWDAQTARLALGAILIDTANLQDAHKTTEHDVRAVEVLEGKVRRAERQGGESYDREKFHGEIETAKMDLDGLSLAEILRKDYKQWDENGVRLGTAAVVRPLEYLYGKDGDFLTTVKEFAQDREVGLCAVMTAYVDEAGEFARQVFVLALDDGKAKAAAERFTSDSTDELQLEDAGFKTPSKIAFARAWKQKNLAASRKQVAPLLRKAMRQLEIRSAI